MQPEDEAEFAAGMMGGPGPEDFANGAAALAAALVREAGALAAAAASLRSAAAVTPGDPMGGPLSDIRRQRLAMAAAGEAALKAALLLEAADLIAPGGNAAEPVAAAARRAGAAPALLVPAIRAAALSLPTDDGAARIAAATIAEALAQALAA
ncbi:hypothetical protein [Belnapia sp. F-4-1]|uniref:hypothetical protein n=1 Tax=Belnapia sp. F-4-1 TaxID=1545443 RepID=UPI0005BE0580|nr:hypothetical protein [Belnapia sp. F-4-1]